MLNLLTDPWLPVLRRQTGQCIIRPAQIAEHHPDDPITAIDWPRPDFRIATMEFLIGLLATAAPPYERADWRRWWREPPSPEELDEKFAPLAHAFNLDGDGPRFLQDFEDIDSKSWPVERLLIEAPGQKTTDDNTDLMVHRDQINALSRASAAIALFTLQSWAPGGGKGFRTGVRGGGPLVTMIVPEPTPTLWKLLWANVPVGGESPEAADLPQVFPWLAPTVTSKGAKVVTPANAHPLQCWWGMPRRIRLDFTPAKNEKPCDLTGHLDTMQVLSWRQLNYGINYIGWGRGHPLTPYKKQKSNPEFIAVHPQADGIGYRHWLGLILSYNDKHPKEYLQIPAAIISGWFERSRDVGIRQSRLIAAGFDIYNNNKIRGFTESEMPLLTAPDAASQKRLDLLAEALVQSADQVASLLRSAVRNALFDADAKVNWDATQFNSIRERLWEATETDFFTRLNTAAENPEADLDSSRAGWLGRLRKTALDLFDEAAPLAADSGATAAARTGKARRLLGLSLAGFGPMGQELFKTLSLPPAETSSAKESKRKRKPA